MEGRDQEDITKQLFIEPGRDGSWCVHGTVEAAISELRWVPASQKKPARHVAVQYEAVSVERASAERPLVLKDKTGKVVDSF
jgi:hypothetical protein